MQQRFFSILHTFKTCIPYAGGIVNNTLRPTIPSYCDSEWKLLMEQCWAPNPVMRPSFTEIASRLRVMSAAAQPRKAAASQGLGMFFNQLTQLYTIQHVDQHIHIPSLQNIIYYSCTMNKVHLFSLVWVFSFDFQLITERQDRAINDNEIALQSQQQVSRGY